MVMLEGRKIIPFYIYNLVLCTIFGEGFQQLFTALREDRDQLIASVSIVFYIWSRLFFGSDFLPLANLIQATFDKK